MQNSHQLSPSRLLVVLGLTVILGASVAFWVLSVLAQTSTEAARTWFAPYVDVTLTPTLHFEDRAEQPALDVVLGFVVADPSSSCSPSWGTYYSLDAAARALDLDRRIVHLRERGGDAIVSFGGAFNDELATVCTTDEQLVAAYQQVIDRYDLGVLDFDIEGAAIANVEANMRRARAIAQLQANNPGLRVWFTLPVAPHGLTPEAVTLIDGLLSSGVDLTGVNVMTMNYAESRSPSTTMHEANLSALHATFQQLEGAYERAGTPLLQEDLWHRIGATPMIGQNDVPTDVFQLSDARELVQFAASVELGRLSFWSANRDIACGASTDDVRVSNTCSSVSQEPLAFSSIFSMGAPNSRADISGDETVAKAEEPIPGRDDPLTSPYPLWRTAKAYEQGSKVVWQRRVYEAKWWTQGDQPDAPVKNTWETPWRYLGPVLESDREAVRADTPAAGGERPNWSGEKVYIAGDEVQLGGEAFRAKWWTQGDRPDEDPDQPYDHPWEYLGEQEEPEKD